MKYASGYSEQSHNIVKKELRYLLCTQLSLTHKNGDEPAKLTKLIDAYKQAIVAFYQWKISNEVH